MAVGQVCPECGAGVEGDPRFTVWCAGCEWNVDPEHTEERYGRVERVRRRLARRYGERLLDEMAAGGGERARLDGFGVLALGFALVVHAVTLAIAASGVWLLVGVRGVGGVVGGVLLLAVAWSMRPRFGRVPEDAVVLKRADAPTLYALIDEVGRAVGTRGVDVVVLDADINASVVPLGLRRRMLVLGLPLWESLTVPQRIAILGHELGHFVNNDTRRGVVVGSAERSLILWYSYLRPVPLGLGWLDFLVRAVLSVPCFLVICLLHLFDLLSLRASQRAEYLADAAAARAGSSDAAVGAMERLLVTESIGTTLRREISSRRLRGRRAGRDKDLGAGLWEELAARMDEIPGHEYERRRRVGARRGHAVDSTHPPTHLRLQLLRRSTPVPATVLPDADRERRIAVELSEGRAEVARVLVRDGMDGEG
ncbi:M48 family metallopeptidase [Streptomyces sp. NPDC048290]|uniref:M48 family metallopeptidase n=1 Tax=Streptomyces sp. NPDC048290 TaxID=3155811 RepID=UPI003431603D